MQLSHLLLSRVLLGAAALSAALAPARAETYTIRYADSQGWGAANTKVHIWDSTTTPDTPYNAWEENDNMTPSGLYIKDGDNYVPVYEYTFEWNHVPTGVIFHFEGISSDQTSNQVFENGALYGYTPKTSLESGIITNPEYIDQEDVPIYTVYFADTRGWGAEGIKIHIWSDSNIPYQVWGSNDSLSSQPERYVLYQGRYVPVYNYTFRWGHTPAGLLFYKTGTGQSDDLSFTDGATYICKMPSEETPETIPDPAFVDGKPAHTVYFADTGGWGNSETLVHVWGTAGDLTPFLSDPSMEDTGKLALVNDVWAKVYKLDFSYDGVAENILFHKKGSNELTADIDFADGALYHYTGVKKPVDMQESPTLLDEIPSTPRPATLYVNLGANQMMETGLWEEPCAHVYRRDGPVESYEALLPEYGSDSYKAEIMTKVRDGFYRIDIDDINSCNDVIFYYSRYNEKGEQTYQDLVFPASRGDHNDPSTWASFIYDIGINCVHQSYLTPDDYFKGWEESPSALFMTGNELVTGYKTDDPIHSVRIASDDDVYIHKFHISAGDVAMLKLSRFDVGTAAAGLGFTIEDGTYDYQRGWATFNLGIIGFQPAPDEPDWRDKYIYAPGNGESRQIKCSINESVNFNSYTQYPWRISSGEGGVRDGDYWLVIDLHDADHSLTLLEFDPNPGLELFQGNINVLNTGYSFTAGMPNSGPHLASDYNGIAGIDRVNVLSGKARVTYREPEYLASLKYSAVYTISLGDFTVGEYEMIPEEVEIPYMTPGIESEVGVRARYTDSDTGRSFCSRISRGSLTATLPDFDKPQEAHVDGIMPLYFANDTDLEAGIITVGGAGTIPYLLDSDLAYYPDYTIDEVVANGSDGDKKNTLVDTGHFLASYPDFGNNYLGIYSDIPWTRHDGSSEYSDDNNWSDYIRRERHLPIHIERIHQVTDIDTKVEGNANLTLHALYPFLTTASVSTIASKNAPALPASNEGLTLTTFRTSAPASISFSGKTISGIGEVTSGHAQTLGEPIYHTISGQRLNGRPTLPGIYTKTLGTTTVKIVVR